MKKLIPILFCVTTTIFISILLIEYKKEKPIKQNEPKIEKIDSKPKNTIEEAISGISSKNLKQDLDYLASKELEGRMSGKKGNVMAADFIKKKFESFGLKTFYQKFSIKKTNFGPKNESGDDFTQNIYGTIKGNDENVKDEIVVIGAHMDHIGYGPSMSRTPNRREVHPGADDNASGTVALIELAKAFSLIKEDLKRTVVFQAYSAEEMGLIGSRYYCENPLFPEEKPDIKKHVFMINLDMVGYLDKGYYFAGFSEGDSSFDVTKIINDLNQKYKFAKKITGRTSGGSDHASFYNKKIPIAFLHTGLHSNYHTPDDTPDKINYEGLEQITKYAFELGLNIINSKSAPEFNFAKFKQMDYNHDHGNPEMPFHHHYHKEQK